MVRWLGLIYLLVSLGVLYFIRSKWRGQLVGDIIASLIIAIPIMLYLGLVLALIGAMLNRFQHFKFDRNNIALQALNIWSIICLVGVFGFILQEQLGWRLVEVSPTRFVEPYFLSFVTAVFGTIVVYIPVVVVGAVIYGIFRIVSPKRYSHTHLPH